MAAEETKAEEEVVSAAGNKVRPLNEEELKALSKDLQEVLVKHNAEMGVTSTINLMKVVETTNDSETENKETVPESVEATKEETDTKTEEGS